MIPYYHLRERHSEQHEKNRETLELHWEQVSASVSLLPLFPDLSLTHNIIGLWENLSPAFIGLPRQDILDWETITCQQYCLAMSLHMKGPSTQQFILGLSDINVAIVIKLITTVKHAEYFTETIPLTLCRQYHFMQIDHLPKTVG